MKSIFLTQTQCPGDILMLTAAVRDLKLAHGDRFAVNVATTAMELWENNPYLDRSITKRLANLVIPMHYPLIHESTTGPYHFIHAFRLYLEDQLNIKIKAGEFKVDIWLSEAERAGTWVKERVGGKPYWIIDAGYKNDFTCKMWSFARYQEVVDRTRDCVTWVQIGSLEHNHKPLQGVIDLRGKTSHRQFVEVMYHSDGVVSPVSYPMHLSTMEWHRSPDRKRPCIVVAGGREPSAWVAYTGHQYLHTCGMLDCCGRGACWKSRVVPLNDSNEKNKSICLYPVAMPDGQVIPKCMDMITADMVVDKVMAYHSNM